MDKFGRRYLLSVEASDGETITIELPFTVEFDITRNVLTSANVCQIRIYNLSQKNRDRIRKDDTDYDGMKRLVNLKAGYGENLPLAFTGGITRAWSVREGTNFITQIECFDGGFAFVTGVTDQQFPSGTDRKTVIETVGKNLPGVSQGVIGNFPGKTSRGNTLSGNTVDILTEQTGGGFFVDNGKFNALGIDECIEGELQLIDAATGLLGTPTREQLFVDFDMVFEPRLVIGQLIELKSSTDATFNSIYKVVSVKHRGMISGSVCGNAITTVRLFRGQTALSVVAP